MFSKVLIANRGEIARRVIRSARRMDIATVAVYSEADELGAHVAEADESFAIGPAPAAQSYLCGDAIIAAARAAGAEAVHPGYGFLSENADFAEAVIAAGLIWIGPSPEVMRMLGDKARLSCQPGRSHFRRRRRGVLCRDFRLPRND
jgi:3-methylcrotonyl-CoA carboxylase alpha subunit